MNMQKGIYKQNFGPFIPIHRGEATGKSSAATGYPNAILIPSFYNEDNFNKKTTSLDILSVRRNKQNK